MPVFRQVRTGQSGAVLEYEEDLSGVMWRASLQCDLEDARDEGIEIGLEQGIEQGIEQGKDLVLSQNARLAEALRAAGRESELLEATLDPARRAELLAEFGIGTSDHLPS